jgi:hypothetical protein
VENLTLAQQNRAGFQNLLTVISVMILIGTEVFGVAFAAGWAIAGLFELGDMVSYILMALFSLIGIYILVNLWRKATTVEPIR